MTRRDGLCARRGRLRRPTPGLLASRAARVLVAALALLALSPRGVVAEDAKPDPEKPAGLSSPGAAWRDVPTLERHLVAACDAVEKACGAKFAKRPTVRVATKEALVAVLRVQAPELPEADAEAKTKEEKEAPDKILDAFAQSLLGLYDAEHHVILVSGENAAAIEKALPLPGLSDEDVLRVALVHEATHALDWPRWGWREVRKARTTNDGRQAFAAVAEGHAQLVAEEVAAAWGLSPAFERMTKGIVGLPETLTGDSRVLADVVVAELTFGYVQGHRFLKAVRGARGPAAVDAFLKDPPAGTAVVEHPEHALDGAPAVDLDLLSKQFDPLVGDAAFTVVRDRVRETMIKSQVSRLPADKRDGFARGYEDGRAVVGQVEDEGMVIAMVLRFAAPEDAKAFVDADREISKASDAENSTGPVRIVESTLTEGAGPGSKMAGFVSLKTVMRMGDEVRAVSEDAVLGTVVVSAMSLGIKDVDRAAIDAALARIESAIRDPEAARKAPAVEPVKLKSLGRRLAVKVVGPDGSAVAKCRLRATWSPSENNTHSHTLEHDGGSLPFRIPAVKATLLVWAPRTAADAPLPLGPMSVDVEPTQASVEVRLGKGLSIVGHVVDGDGKPVEGVEVAAVPDLPDGSGRAREAGPADEFKQPDYAHAVATSGADGAFRVDPVGDMPYWLVVRTAAAEWTGAPVRARGGEAGAKVVAEHAQAVEVTVLGPDDKPVAEASVAVESVTRDGTTTSWTTEVSTKTGPDGVARLGGIRALGEHALEVHPPADRKDVGMVKFERWRVEAKVTVRLPAGRVIEGTLRGPSGPVVGSVSWHADGRSGYAIATPDGRFRLEGVPAGAVDLWASEIGGPGGLRGTARVDAVTSTVDIVLSAKSPAFEPATPADRTLRIEGLKKGDVVQFVGSDDTAVGSTASEDGKVTVPYVLERVPKATLFVVPRHGQGLLAPDVPLDDPTRKLALVATKTITGRLQGDGLRYPEVAAIGPGRVTVVGQIGDDGTFSVQVPPGRYAVRAKARTDAAWVYGAVEAEAGATGVEVPLAPRR